MIKALNKQMTISATSVVTVNTPTGDVEVPINYMAANIKTDGQVSITEAIQNRKVYLQNIDVAKQDYDQFRDYVNELSSQETE